MERSTLLSLAANVDFDDRIMRVVIAQTLLPGDLLDIPKGARAQQTKIRWVPKKHLTRGAVM
jgi:hypothetical protein